MILVANQIMAVKLLCGFVSRKRMLRMLKGETLNNQINGRRYRGSAKDEIAVSSKRERIWPST